MTDELDINLGISDKKTNTEKIYSAFNHISESGKFTIIEVRSQFIFIKKKRRLKIFLIDSIFFKGRNDIYAR